MSERTLTIGMAALLALVSGCAEGVIEFGANEEGGGSGGASNSYTQTGGGSSTTTGGGGGASEDAGTADSAVACTGAAECDYLTSECRIGACINGLCSTLPQNEQLPCDDGTTCTSGEHCQAGSCVGGTAKVCPQPDPCHIGVCDPATDQCSSAPGNNGASCNDLDPCTGVGACQNGVCAPGPPIDCTFLSGPCSLGVCDPQLGCTVQPLAEGAACDPKVGPCSAGTCQAGACVPSPILDGEPCDDGMYSPCSEGTCQAGTCVPQPVNEGGFCDDYMYSECSEGMCVAGKCSSQPANEGGPCEAYSGDPCVVGQCQDAYCTLVPANDGDPCDDWQFCTINTTCQAGACGGGEPNPCAPPGGCWIASCDPVSQTCSAAPGNDGATCDDGSPCTEGTTCSAGACVGGTPANDGATCDDGASCTTGETCAAGSCGGGVGPEVYLSEDFADNAAGWTLGTEWQIGPAQASSGGSLGGDPAFDHTLTADNGIAGVVIGGNATTSQHPPYYIESPTFDASGAAGPIILGFYRWLNSDYDPYMHNYVEVYDGTQWVEIWKSGPSPAISDSSWTFIEHDITAYKSASMRVRFGFDITSSGVYTIGSWNLDDVLVAATACP